MKLSELIKELQELEKLGIGDAKVVYSNFDIQNESDFKKGMFTIEDGTNEVDNAVMTTDGKTILLCNIVPDELDMGKYGKVICD